MTTRDLPFGFHMGIGGNAAGLKTDYAQLLSTNGIPFTVMSADAMPFDFQEIAKTSNVKHFVGFRRSVPHNGQVPPSGDVNVPNYSKTPVQAAQEHTNWMLDHLPSELNSAITWVTDINEPRHSEVDHPGITEWLAQYSIEAAKICWANGYKYIALNFAGGNHPLWKDAGTYMKQLYQLAADNPDKLIIGTHEYSFTADNILEGDGYLIGRIVLQLVDYMPNVPVVVTEFGWGETTVPTVEKAMEDYLLVANTYYNRPSVKYVATWYLGNGFGGIAQKVQPFIHPIGQKTLTTEIEVPNTTPVPPPTGDCDCSAITEVRTISLWIPPYSQLSNSEINQVYSWARYGFPDNDGVYTPGNHMLCPSHVDALRIHTTGLPGSVLGIAYPERIGTGVDLNWIEENCPCALQDDKQVVFLGRTSGQAFQHPPVITR